MEKFKILVIEDKQIHQGTARGQLQHHDLTVVGSYEEGRSLLCKKHDFEIVMSDLLMPPTGRALVGKHEGEMDLGIYLALLAAKNGARLVSVLTDASHHSHPVSACLDEFSLDGHGRTPVPLVIEKAKVFLCNDYQFLQAFNPDDLTTPIRRGTGVRYDGPMVEGKDWLKLLDFMLKHE